MVSRLRLYHGGLAQTLAVGGGGHHVSRFLGWEGDRALFSYLFSGILTLLAEFFLARYRDKVYNCLVISYRLCAADAGRRNGKEVRRTGERWQACRASRGWSLPTLPIM